METKSNNQSIENRNIDSNVEVKLIEEVIHKFNKKYINISKDLNNFQNDFLNQMKILIEAMNTKNKNIKLENSLKKSKPLISENSANSKANKKINLQQNQNICVNLLHQNKSSNNITKVSLTKSYPNRYKKHKKLYFETKNDPYSNTNINSMSKEICYLSEQKNNFTMHKNYKKFTQKKDNSINKSASLNSNQFIVSPKKSQSNRIKQNKELIKNFNVIKGLKICAESKIFNLKEKVKIKYLNKSLKKEINLQIIYKNLIEEDYLNNIDEYPSKTIQFGLNFISQKNNEQIINSNTNEIKQIIELLYILLGISDSYVYENNSADLFNLIFRKFDCHNIKGLFFDVILQKIFIKKDYSRCIVIPFLNKFVDLKLDEINTSSFIYLCLKEICCFFFIQYLIPTKNKIL